MNWLTIADLARILGQERLRRDLIRSGVPEEDITDEMLADAPPLKSLTIQQYLKMARRVAQGDPRVRQQYIENPFPLPSNEDDLRRGNYTPVWAPARRQEQRVRRWARRRPGPGVGGGRKPAGE
jgi:hypothetical protein